MERVLTCPFGHHLTPGRVLVGWSPCLCSAALDHYRGHRTVQCLDCADEKRATVRYIPEHIGGGHPNR